MTHPPSKKRTFASYDRDEDEEPSATIEPLRKVARHHSPDLSHSINTPYRSVISILLERAMNENVNVQMLMKHYVLLQCSEMARRLPEHERLRNVEELVYKFFWDDGKFPGDVDERGNATDEVKTSSNTGSGGDADSMAITVFGDNALKALAASSSEPDGAAATKVEESDTIGTPDALAEKAVATAVAKRNAHLEAKSIARYGPVKGGEVYKKIMDIFNDYDQFVVRDNAAEKKDEAPKA